MPNKEVQSSTGQCAFRDMASGPALAGAELHHSIGMRITQFEGTCRRASNVQPLVAAGGEPLHTDFAGARLLCVLDHVEARLVVADDATVILECHNPTAFDATVRVCAESSAAARTILGQAASLRWPALDIPAGATRALAL